MTTAPTDIPPFDPFEEFEAFKVFAVTILLIGFLVIVGMGGK